MNWRQGDPERRKGREVYNDTIIKFLEDKHLENVTLLATIETNQINMMKSFDEWKKDFKEHIKDDNKTFDELSNDIQGVKDKLTWYAGAVAGVTFVVTVFGEWISKLLFKN